MKALRHAGLSALVAFGLFGPMVGLKTEAGDRALYLLPRPALVAIMVGIVFLGSLALSAWGNRPRREVVAANRRKAEAISKAGRYIAPALLVVALVLPFLASRSYLDLGVVVLTYILLGWGLNIVVGLAGLLDLGYVAFYAVGAYTYAIFSTSYGLGFWTCLPLAGLFAAIAGIALGFPVLRLRGDYLAIVTLGFGEIIRIVLNNWTHLTNGPNGILDIPRPTLFGLSFSAADDGPNFADFFHLDPSPTYRVAYLYYVVLGLALLTNWVTLRLRRLPLGRAWEALREDEVACRSLGINVTITKLTAFAIGAMFGGFAGAFFATRNAFVSPESFTFIESAIVLAIVVLGGLGSQLGVALAAIITIGGLELFRQWLSELTNQPGFHWIAGTFGDIGQYYKLIFGLAMVLMMILRPRGLVSGRTPSVSLGPPREIAPVLPGEANG
jgi:branched-chain amino acid transport system permease protein